MHKTADILAFTGKYANDALVSEVVFSHYSNKKSFIVLAIKTHTLLGELNRKTLWASACMCVLTRGKCRLRLPCMQINWAPSIIYIFLKFCGKISIVIWMFKSVRCMRWLIKWDLHAFRVPNVCVLIYSYVYCIFKCMYIQSKTF